jgi:hypothetical protein
MTNALTKAIKEKLIPADDLRDRDAYIYLACSGLTITAQMILSSKEDGIILLYDKMLTAENCPHEEDFHVLFAYILSKK